MNRRELTAALARRSGAPEEQAEAVLSALSDLLVEAVASGGGLRLPGVLAVERVQRPARTGRNPRTGEALEIPASHAVRLTAGARLKAAASGSPPT